MEEIYLLIIVGISAFIGTSLDNLAMLISFFAVAGKQRSSVFIGYGIAVAIVLLICWFGTAITLLVPISTIGLLGLIPIGIGVYELYLLVRKRGAGDLNNEPEARKLTLSIVASTQLAAAGDALAVFIPLFAESTHPAQLILTKTYLVMAAVTVAVASAFSGHVGIRNAVSKYEPMIKPFVLIGIGIYVLQNSTSDLVPGF